MKDIIRKQVLETRNKMSADTIVSQSHSIFVNLKESGFIDNVAHIMIYLNFKQEVQTNEIINYCLERKKNVYIPVCIPETHELCISRITTLEELQLGHFGIREPKPEFIRLSDSSLVDLVLVPGIAFDNAGNRVGFGAGYYDRFMRRLQPKAVKAALAYSFQVVDLVPSDEYDIPVDYIITEESTVFCKHVI